ncbi:MAG: glycosyltransferase, partial [Candidatus Eisenbacteria bacterium]|nr:glycosyltransferase [Candidatus Eisenbacteria bacterium]
ERWAEREPRLRVAHLPPSGLPAALEHGRRMARSPWIARQDADDVSHRRRLERQFAYLDAHPGIDVVGTCIRLFPSHSVGIGMQRWAVWHNTLLTHDQMRRELLIDSPLAHGTAMIRQAALDRVQGWHEHGWAEDLDLWIRLVEADAHLGKVMEPLYGWRQHPHSSTRTDARYSQAHFTALKVATLDRGLLAGGRTATLIGVGSSLQRWRDALGARLAASVELRQPPGDLEGLLTRPLVLALMAPQARERWRRHLAAAGAREMQDFIFVS